MNIFLKALKLNKLLKGLGIKPSDFILPVVFSLCASVFEGISIGVLIPMLKGIISMDFSFVKDFFIFKVATDFLPELSDISNTPIFILLLFIIFISAILKNILQYGSIVMVSYRVREFSCNIRNTIFKNYLSFGKTFFDTNNLGHLYNVLMNYTSMVAEKMQNIRLFINAMALMVIYVLIMLVISWRLFLLTCILFPFLNYMLKLVIAKIKEISALYELSLEGISKKISNILSCMSLVKLYTWEDKERNHFFVMSKEIQKNEFKFDKKYNLVQPMQEIFFLTAILILVSSVAFMHVKERSGDLAGFLVFFLLLKRMQNLITILSNFFASLATVSAPINAIYKILDKKDKFIIDDGTQEFTGLKKGIELKDLSFSYLRERQVLRGVSFSIEKGKITAIVGPTGAGKTTIINLILRFYDCPPKTIMIDGKDIRDFTFKSLLAHMSLVSQDALLFNGTIEDNITYGLNREVTKDELFDVIKKARLDDFVSGLREGLNTYIGDKGIKLSGGEKQRVSIARALLKGSEILILDEATSSLDTKTERLIQEAVNEAIKDRTAVVIAHRLSTIKNADNIIFIDSGRVMEDGTLDELLQRKGRFYESWQEQKFY